MKSLISKIIQINFSSSEKTLNEGIKRGDGSGLEEVETLISSVCLQERYSEILVFLAKAIIPLFLSSIFHTEKNKG